MRGCCTLNARGSRARPAGAGFAADAGIHDMNRTLRARFSAQQADPPLFDAYSIPALRLSRNTRMTGIGVAARLCRSHCRQRDEPAIMMTMTRDIVLEARKVSKQLAVRKVR